MRLQLSALREYLRTSLWFVPALCVLAAVVLAAGTLAFDGGDHGQAFLAFTGSADSARSVLTAIASSIVTLTALVFSLTMVVLQLASSQYSPRVVRSFLRDRLSQLVLGTFLATFTYTMLVLRAVRGEDQGGSAFVPELSVHVAYVLVGVSLVLFVVYIHHIAKSMQASNIVTEVAEDTARALRRIYPTVGEDPPGPTEPLVPELAVAVTASRSGYLQTVQEDALLRFAVERRCVVCLVPSVGDFVPAGSLLFRASCDVDDPDVLRRSVKLGRQRTMQQDPMFGFRQLVDVAEKALSPGINDPTTAVQAIDRIHELLIVLAPRRFPRPERTGPDGVLRLVLPRPSWDSVVALAFDEIRHYGEGSIQVTRRLRAVAEDLLECVPASRRPALERQVSLLDRSAERGFDDAVDVAHAKHKSRHG